jgi:hypothetical protein
MDIAEKDLHLLQIQEEIRNKKNLLIKKKKDLDKNYKLNDFLSNVKDDYTRYYDYILNEKQQQYNALILLKEYMSDLSKTENVVDEQMRHIKYDQRDILKEIDKVKAELDNLMT